MYQDDGNTHFDQNTPRSEYSNPYKDDSEYLEQLRHDKFQTPQVRN